jgi:DNA-binding response OmpR family regulator
MPKVLLIDSDGSLASRFEPYLKVHGYEVLVAKEGGEGMIQALSAKPDVIFLDGYLPDATGFQMCNRFRRKAETQGIPIIMVSNLAEFPNQQQYALERGANAHVLKSSKVVELGELVDRYVGMLQEPKYQTPPVNVPNRAKSGQPVPAARPPFDLSERIHMELNPRLRDLIIRDSEDASA